MNSETLNMATEWWLKLREPNVSPATIAQWMQWCEEHPSHEDAFARVQALWQAAGRAPLKPVSAAELAGNDVASAGPLSRASGRRRLLALAASITGIALAAALFVYSPWRSSADLRAATSIGDNRDLRLPDGSRATLGGASALSTAFTEQRRTVRLERGEAFFDVKPDRNRPFTVVASSLAITAIGTAFNVRTDEDMLRVTVTEGVVDILAEGATGKAHRLHAGQQLSFSTAAKPTIGETDPALAIAWTTGTLKFLDEPLDSVVAVVNRYSVTPIELSSPGLSDLRYTGTVVTDRIDEWLAALPNSFPVQVARKESTRVVLESIAH